MRTERLPARLKKHLTSFGMFLLTSTFVNRIGGVREFEIQARLSSWRLVVITRQCKSGKRLGFRLSDAAPIKMSAKKY
jgi:hypothetical protein